MRNPSSICSKYYQWFVEMGYPQLDINQYSDGSWDIIEYYNSPIIPCLTKYRTVLGNMKNVEISKSFCEKYIAEIDLRKRRIWDREEEKSRRVEAEHEAVQVHREDFAERAFKAIKKNDGLMDRIAKKGLSEMNLTKIAKHIPTAELKAMKQG